MKSLLSRIVTLPGQAIVLAVKLYQFSISPLLGKNCRFTPSCSEYFIESVTKYGAILGTWRGCKRICRCHPWNVGGHDPP
jgi:putative membrane protein insertion efficiency factor